MKQNLFINSDTSRQIETITRYQETKNLLSEKLPNQENINISRDRKEIKLKDLHQLEKIIKESLSKTMDFEKKREYVIQGLKAFDPCQFSWEKYFNFNEKGGYARNLVLENELFELLIICWDKDCITPIHDHPSDGCWMIGVEGKIFEEKFIKNKDESLTKTSHSTLGEREIAWIHDYVGYHTVGNVSKDKRAVTLHIYSPPIRMCNCYEKNGAKIMRTLKNFN